MKMHEIIGIAKGWGIHFKVGLSKTVLIRAIQQKEGYRDLFAGMIAAMGKCAYGRMIALPASKK